MVQRPDRVMYRPCGTPDAARTPGCKSCRCSTTSPARPTIAQPPTLATSTAGGAVPSYPSATRPADPAITEKPSISTSTTSLTGRARTTATTVARTRTRQTHREHPSP